MIEPREGTVVLDRYGMAWQRADTDPPTQYRWWMAGDGSAYLWDELNHMDPVIIHEKRTA